MDPCQCNDDCPTYFNCCDDYDDLCVPKGSLFRVVIVVTVLVGGVVVVGIPVSSVASFLVLGGGGARPRNVATKIYRRISRERAKRASATEKYIFMTQNTSA